MATTQAAAPESTLQDLAKRHLWLHFSRMGAYAEADIPIIVKGDGCYVWDEHGNKYLDGLSALFCVNIGHGRHDVAQAGADQAKELGFFTTWSYAHPRAIGLAAKLASLAPGDLNRVFFTSGGSESVETALKLARQYHKLTGHPNKHKVIAREVAYHGTTMGALSATGVTALRQPFEPFTPGGCHVPNTNLYRLPPGYGAENLAEAVAHRIGFEGPEKYDYLPDIITTAKGLTSSYAPMGAVIARDRVMEPFLEGTNSFAHGITWGGHPMCAAVALANLDVFEREGLLEHVRENEADFRAMLESLRDIDIVGDIRGSGYFHAIELVKDPETKQSFSDEESETMLRGFLSGELFRRGLICRADDRGDPVIQLSPPLIAGPEQFEEMESILRPVLEEASRRMLHG